MKSELNVALHLKDGKLADEIAKELRDLGGVRLVGKSGNGSVPSASAHVVIVHEQPGAGDILERISTLRRHLPDGLIFVVSADKHPEHVVEVMKAGAAEYFVTPVDSRKIREAIEKAKDRLIGSVRTAQGNVYSFMSSKGGLGSTVVSVNAAAAMALRGGGSVALIDNSLQAGDSSVLLDVVPHTTFGDICRNFHRLDASLLKGAMVTHPTGLHFLAAPTAPEDGSSIGGEHVGRILQLAKALYDDVFVDCRSMFVDECSLEAFKASDRIFILTDLSVTAVRNAGRVLQLLQKVRIDASKIEIVVNRFIKGGVPSVGEIERTLNKRVFWLFPNDFDDIIRSINQGAPLVKEKPGSPFSKNVKDFVEKIKNSSAVNSYRGVKGFLGRAM